MNIHLEIEEIKIRRKKLLASCSFNLTEGVIVIKGRNGIGKTTLAKKIYHQLKEEHQEVSSVFLDQSNDEILVERSVLENIAMTSNSKVLEKVKGILETIELEYLLSCDVKKLSGGEKRIIAILRAFISDAKIIMMDEPTNDLDYRMVEKLCQWIQMFSKEKIFLIVTHDSRLLKIADSIFEISNTVLNKCLERNAERKTEYCEKQWDLKRTFQKESIAFMEDSFHKNYISILSCCILILAIIFLGIKTKDLFRENMELGRENQIDISIPGVSDDCSVFTGAVPTKLFANYSDKNIYQTWKVYEKVFTQFEKEVNQYTLDLESTENYNVYKVEYYDLEKRKSHNVLDTCVTEILKDDIDDMYIDIDEVFYLPDYPYTDKRDYKNVITFSDAPYQKAVDYLERKKELKLVHLVVVLKEGYTFMDFVKDPQFQKISQGHYYIQANETIRLMKALQSFKQERNIMLLFGMCIILVLILEVVYIITDLVKIKGKIKIWLNYGIKQEVLQKVILHKNDDRYLRVIYSLLLIGVTVIIQNENLQKPGTYVFPVLSMAAFSIIYKLKKMIILKSIKDEMSNK